MASLNLSPPWVIYYNELAAFFKYDNEVRVIYDDEEHTVKLYVSNANKAKALESLLDSEVEFGNVVMKIIVIPPNTAAKTKLVRNVFSVALEGNPIVSKIETLSGVFNNPITFVVFRKQVVQFWTDDIGDYSGIRSTLYQTIADELFANHKKGVFFSTDTEDPVLDLGSPLGEWP